MSKVFDEHNTTEVNRTENSHMESSNEMWSIQLLIIVRWECLVVMFV